METGYMKGDSANLPRIDSLMVGDFFARNKDFCEAEFRNVKSSLSSRESYGDDAVGYVQLKRDSNKCTVKCRMCPEHKVRAKPYTVTVIVDEKDGVVLSAQCQDCPASAGGCKHAIAFLMWLHRRSEEPSCTQVECYWKKSQLSKVGTTLKFITAKELAGGSSSSDINKKVMDDRVFKRFLQETALPNSELSRYVNNSTKELEEVSMHYLSLKYREPDCNLFIAKIMPLFTEDILKMVEQRTCDQAQSHLWHELRFARLTASKAYDISKCKTKDGSLVSLVMGGKIPDTPAMKRGRILEDKVRRVVQSNLNTKMNKCGLFICQDHPFLAASPDGIGKDFLIEIKCPSSQATIKNYINNGKPSNKCLAQVQLQMFICKIRKCYFCVADSNFQSNNKVTIIEVDYDETYVNSLLKSLLLFWKNNIYPLLFKMAEE